jgi:hypothetical protein
MTPEAQDPTSKFGNAAPLCPRCNLGIDKIRLHPTSGLIMFSCPNCCGFLGVQIVAVPVMEANVPAEIEVPSGYKM